MLCCGYTLTDFPISIRLTSLALWQSNDCPSASKATLMNMDKYFMWIHYERLHNHNKAKHNKTVCIFLGIYCIRAICDVILSVGTIIGLVGISWLFPMGSRHHNSLKQKCRHFDEIFIAGCTGSCHFDNFQCSQWWTFHQNEDFSVSVTHVSYEQGPFLYIWINFNLSMHRWSHVQ